MKYRATYETAAHITVDIDVPDDVAAEGEDYVIDWVADQSHSIASGEIETWGVVGRARLDLTIDGIGAETVVKVEDGE